MGISELEIISIIRRAVSDQGLDGLKVPIGDDAALVECGSQQVLLTIDAFHEEVHFSCDTHSPADIGWKAVSGAVSDVAAMGGVPRAVLLSLAFGAAPSRKELRQLLKGVLDACSHYGASLAGGDTTRTTSGLSVTVSVLGIPGTVRPVLRSGARVDDCICVTGELGGSAAGLYLLENGLQELKQEFPGQVRRHLRPVAQLRASALLAKLGVNAMIDISDGLTTDLTHICKESSVGCEVDRSLVPISGETKELASRTSMDPLKWALDGGEDYELLFTCYPGLLDMHRDTMAEWGIRMTAIGRIVEEEKGRRLVGKGRPCTMKGKGFEHFR